MTWPRRFLPPIALLAAFEATARAGSVTGAAEELDLTQSAVSRQIRALEARLQVALFARRGRRLELTPAGARYLAEVRRALGIIGRASQDLVANPDGGVLNLAMLPTFGARWLAPRLPRFLQAHPGVTLNLATRLRPFDFAAEGHDAAIHFGPEERLARDWPGAEAAFLMHERVAPMCAPALAPRARSAEALARGAAPLLRIATRPRAWDDWLAAEGAPPPRPGGMTFDQFAALARAAMSGLGVALLPLFMTETERARGELVIPCGRPRKSAGAYWLVWPAGAAEAPPLSAFRDWLLTETARPAGGSG
ncbi:LysR family transcriptional regulator [Oceanicella actignis]|uniref:LysR family transcriptional regulator, glycine cleavage system transcriptional activator n=1 Tax=Oceanicella actignis TaxID=1189325 RepID=A0A1M7SGS0_9RHOB|nr:LysR family transcriptional regulator [Oceanicella actignis]TYO91254.1 LysR family glycine cleavage system transcriptional activator [Oceanicella actignis]SET20736.1 LysR family transcriptional regulator, glycine cleavage system transcriptional activator [Oceanicella actignis]SHN57678.1 LysR family transcriptional regulator, glycine cleavage system transcriptional activator [Oceanicella actignis]